jgi:hypothetical protein
MLWTIICHLSYNIRSSDTSNRGSSAWRVTSLNKRGTQLLDSINHTLALSITSRIAAKVMPSRTLAELSQCLGLSVGWLYGNELGHDVSLTVLSDNGSDVLIDREVAYRRGILERLTISRSCCRWRKAQE